MRHLLLVFLFLFTTSSAGSQSASQYDLVIYGGTAAAVTAAVQAQKMGKTVVIVSPDKHLGGLSSGGLGFTDTGNKAVIGGLAREFYHRVWKHYAQTSTWKWENREEYGNKGQGTPAIDGEQRTMWIFEPHVAEQAFEEMIKEHRIPVHRDEWLDRKNGVKKSGARITSITTLSGKRYAGKMFIDATYEGDLMAALGVDYHVGRESTSVYGEKWNGVQTGALHHRHHFGAVARKISPYVIPGDPKSGVLSRVSAAPPGEYGQGDKRVQAYNFRMCLTDHPDNREPFPNKPAGYNPKRFELLARFLAEFVKQKGRAPRMNEILLPAQIAGKQKWDFNNRGPFSTDYIGKSWDYPNAGYKRRAEIWQDHKTYTRELFYFLVTDPRVPQATQDEIKPFGLAKDEFVDNDNWPYQLYVREARRMVGDYVVTQKDIQTELTKPDVIAMGSYNSDSHNVQRYVTPEGAAQNEGNMEVPVTPYQIPYRILLPKKSQATNLFVPVCFSASHVTYSTLRMEPQYMMIGQAAGVAAKLAIEKKSAAQEVDAVALTAKLRGQRAVMEWKNNP